MEDGRRVLSSVVASQMDTHGKYGGVVPELASREHLKDIVPVVREALEAAKLSLADIDAVAVTQGPGLVGSLLVGLTYGKALAMSVGKPLLGVNHLEGHVHAVLLQAHLDQRAPEMPAICLIVSGGHTVLYEVKTEALPAGAARMSGLPAPSRFVYSRLGQTRDDAAGEAYDKVARILALGYPGGPILDQLAPHGNSEAVRFTPPVTKGNSLDFSFSGIKTAMLRHVCAHPEMQQEISAREAALARGERAIAQLLPLCSKETLDLVASFQKSVVADLVNRTLAAAEQCGVRSILVSGGVAANSELRRRFDEQSRRTGVDVYFPSRALSTDNAAMIAAAAFSHLLAGEVADYQLNAEANFPLA